MIITYLKLMIKKILAPIMYRYYPVTLSPLRLHLWASEVIKAKDIEGDCVEIGVMLGGTSVFSKKILDELKIRKKYYCYDTFSGFVKEQVAGDIQKGLFRDAAKLFNANSEKLVRKIFSIHNVEDIITVKGDIVQQAVFPEKVSCCLLDVDLAEPTYHALVKIFPVLSQGGAVVIDDCNDAEAMGKGDWRAHEGVLRFARERALHIEYRYGMGILRKR